MSIQVQFIILIVSLLAGMIAIFLSNRLMKKYPLTYLASYFYYLIFTYIFSVYSIVGSQSIKFILRNQIASIETIQSIVAILIAMGIPFLILSWYMFIRLSREFFQQEIPKLFVALYFSLFAVSFIAYALLNLDIGGIETVTFFMDREQLLWTFTGLQAGAYGLALVYILIKSRSIQDINQRKTYSWFGIWYLSIVILMILCLHLSEYHIIFGLGFVLVLTGFHLIPVLFLNIYIPRFYVPAVESASFDERLRKMISEFEISKRETEIIILICKGMSNQEISDSLFISLQTVKDHIHRIFQKTGVRNRVQLSNLVGSDI